MVIVQLPAIFLSNFFFFRRTSKTYLKEPVFPTRFPCVQSKNPPANAGDLGDWGLIPGSGRSSGGGDGTPLQYSCLENPMDQGAWWATVLGVAKSLTRRSTRTHTHNASHTDGFLSLSEGRKFWIL